MHHGAASYLGVDLRQTLTLATISLCDRGFPLNSTANGYQDLTIGLEGSSRAPKRIVMIHLGFFHCQRLCRSCTDLGPHFFMPTYGPILRISEAAHADEVCTCPSVHSPPSYATFSNMAGKPSHTHATGSKNITHPCY